MLRVALGSSTRQDAGSTAHPSKGLAVPIHCSVTRLCPTQADTVWAAPCSPCWGDIGCVLHSGPRVSQSKVHREPHKGLKNHRESYKCKVHGWVYFCGCHSTGTVDTSWDAAPACTALFIGDATLHAWLSARMGSRGHWEQMQPHTCAGEVSFTAATAGA